jgi:tetratricopeptide (TPR) repeat protein
LRKLDNLNLNAKNGRTRLALYASMRPAFPFASGDRLRWDNSGMATNRLEILKQMVEQDPRNSFARYGLAMEYGKSGGWEQALAEYRELLRNDATYVAAYFQGGQASEKLGNLEDARAMYEQGITAATQKGDAHTRAEIEAALQALPL